MSIVDLRKHPELQALQADVCVVGAGAAGIAVALEVAASGRLVTLVEAGSFESDPLQQALYDMQQSGQPLRANYMSRARQFGGSCNLWAGRSMPLNEIDFAARDWVPQSGWPIAHAELLGDYARAAELLELPALDDAACGRYRELLSADERALFASGDFVPTYSVWARRTQRFAGDYRRLLGGSKAITLLINASVTHIQLNAAGREVRSLLASSLGRNQVELQARRYVLACGGLENARLLLVSRDRQPRGIGNDSDHVGRYFMDHPRTAYGRVHVPTGKVLRALRGRPLPDGKLQIGIGMSYALQQRERLLNHYATLELQTSGYAEARYQALVQTAKVLLKRGHAGSRWDLRSMRVRDLPSMMYLLSPKEIMPHWAWCSWIALRDLKPQSKTPQTFIVVYFCEQPPDPSSRALLMDERDALGMPKLHLHWRIDQSVRASILKMQELLKAQLTGCGLGTLEEGSGDMHFTDASHHMGTTRMSAAPADGVVDVNCRVHGVGNLYIAGSSVFPAAGHANPTISLVALAVRLGRHLLQQR